MARSTRLVILIKNIYTLWGRKHFFLPVIYFPTNLVYPFTLRVTGIITMSTFETQNDYTLVQTHYLIFFVWLVSAKYLSPMPTQAFYIAACRVRTFYKVSFVLNINQHGYTLYFRCHINYSIFFRNKATVKIGFSKKTFY